MSAVKFCQTCQNYRPLHDFTSAGNVAWYSYRINTMKGNLSEADFYDEIERILQLANNRGIR